MPAAVHEPRTPRPAASLLRGTLPLLDGLISTWEALEATLRSHRVGVRAEAHARLADEWLRKWQGFDGLVRAGRLPADCVTSMGSVGISGYMLDVTLVDAMGLTDAVVARHPPDWALPDNLERVMAHDRYPPPGYLEQRGVNIWFHSIGPERPPLEGPDQYRYQLADGRWILFTSDRPEWVYRAFDPERLQSWLSVSTPDGAGGKFDTPRADELPHSDAPN
jgi:hypothetical protein